MNQAKPISPTDKVGHRTVDRESLAENQKLARRDQLEPLIRRHGPALIGFLNRSTNDRDLAEDIFQETFLKVWEKRRSYKPSLPFRPWLFKIALNQLRQEFRRRSRRGEVVSDEIASGQQTKSATPQDDAIQSEARSGAVEAVRALPEQQRTVLSLRIWDDFSYQEIATILGCAEATARANMHHALCALRRKLGVSLEKP